MHPLASILSVGALLVLLIVLAVGDPFNPTAASAAANTTAGGPVYRKCPSCCQRRRAEPEAEARMSNISDRLGRN